MRETVRPESLNASSRLSVSEQEPETKDWLGQDVKNGIGDDLSINTPLACSISNTPNDWVESPENESEATNGSEETSSLVVLGGNSTTTWNGKLVDDDEEGSARHGIVAPLLSISGSESSEETEKNHEDIGDNGDEDVGSVQPCKECKVEKKEWCGDCPVSITCPEDLSVNVLGDIWSVLVNVVNTGVCEGVSVASSHCEV